MDRASAVRHPRPVPAGTPGPKLLSAKGRMFEGCTQQQLPMESCCPSPGDTRSCPQPPRGAGHRRPLPTPAAEQKPGFGQRDDTTPDKASRLPPKVLPALYRHRELDHGAPEETGECNYPCPADGEDDLAARAAEQPDLLAPSSVPSPRQQPPHRTQQLSPCPAPWQHKPNCR